MSTSVTVIGDLQQPEIDAYIAYIRDKHGRIPDTLTLTVDGDYVDLDFTFEGAPFERIRRITGYLAVTSKWNGAKRAELRDRQTHE